MFLKTAQGINFRNYKEFSLEFSSPINIFTGENGQGKSSCLEALYCALRGKSFYSFVQSQFIQHQKEISRICLSLEEKQGISSLEASFSFSENRFNKEILYCGKKVSPSFLAHKFPCFAFTEENMKCIRQGPDQRRIFIDEMLEIGVPKQAKESFNRVLKEKRTLLKDAKQGLLSLEEAYKVLEALNPIFLQNSVQLVEERLKILKKTFSNLKILKQEFFKESSPQLSFSYYLSKNKPFLKETKLLPSMQEDLKKKQALELQAGIPLSGPQKHEIYFLFNGKDSRFFCSKGQQRLFLLALLGSCIDQLPKAFLFLDDVLLELDEKTQNNFLQFLEKKHCQTFLTNCKVVSFKTEKTSFFSVKKGIVKRI